MTNGSELNRSKYWWTEKPAYIGYIVRELSAIPIIIYAIYYLLFLAGYGEKNIYIEIFGLIGAFIHGLTWMGAMSKLLPFNSTEKNQNLLVFACWSGWVIFSYIVYLIIYA